MQKLIADHPQAASQRKGECQHLWPPVNSSKANEVEEQVGGVSGWQPASLRNITEKRYSCK